MKEHVDRRGQLGSCSFPALNFLLALEDRPQKRFFSGGQLPVGEDADPPILDAPSPPVTLSCVLYSQTVSPRFEVGVLSGQGLNMLLVGKLVMEDEGDPRGRGHDARLRRGGFPGFTFVLESGSGRRAFSGILQGDDEMLSPLGRLEALGELNVFSDFVRLPELSGDSQSVEGLLHPHHLADIEPTTIEVGIPRFQWRFCFGGSFFRRTFDLGTVDVSAQR